MYVCVCAAVTESQVEACVVRGVRTLAGLRAEFGLDGLENPCGRCTRTLLDILERHADRQLGEPAAINRV